MVNKDWAKGYQAGKREFVKEIKKKIRKIDIEDAMTDSFGEFKQFLLFQVDIVAKSESTQLTGTVEK